VDILRSDGEAGADVLAVTVRTYYMPNEDWRAICERGRVLRLAAGTLTGQAAGMAPPAALEPATAVPGLPEPLASVVAHLGDGLDTREFVSTAELVAVLDIEPTTFGKRMGELGCQPQRSWIDVEDGPRRVRGYTTADLRTAVRDHDADAP
jgi:S-DNA-T family DNA segregation ATPase FtsK/SpoIIIE